MTDRPMKTATRLVHTGRNPSRQHGIVNPPVYHASTVLFESLDALEASSVDPFAGIHYGRHGTPLQFEFENAVAELEGAYGAVATCSGLAAITIALFSVVEAGSHLLVADNVYGPTRKFCESVLRPLGVAIDYFDPLMDANTLAELFGDHTRAVFLEAPGSLTFEIPDVPALAEAAHQHDVTVLADNTWATPLYFRGFDHGIDISIHAATKYIVGHADAMLGVINCNEAHYMSVRRTMGLHGYCAGPDDIYLGLRGLRTLGQRLPTHGHNSLRLANWLAEQPSVTRVIHPARADHPQHATWQRDFSGATGLFAFQLVPGAREQLTALVDHLELFGLGFSWGGYESLVLPVSPNMSRSATRWDDSGPLIRVHAGLEDPDDLIEDLSRGLERFNTAV